MDDKLAGYQLIPYTIKLTTPWKTATDTLLYREGILLKLQTETGLEGTGECAPLPAIGTETLQAANQQLNNILPNLPGQTVSQVFDSLNTEFPAANFAIETALLDLQAKQHNTSMAKLLNADAAAEIKVNTMLGHLDNNILHRVKQAETQGFKVLKIKMGINSADEELSRLELLIKQLQPHTLLRLDANQAWDIKQSVRILDTLERYSAKIDSLEEPLKYYDDKQYRQLQRSTSIPLALDESFSMLITQASKISNLPLRRIIIKPVAIGSLVQSYRIAKLARKHNIDVIITSSIETGYGLRANTCLAAAIDNNQTHGLATGHWLEETLIPAPKISNGKIHLG
jgi:o-succinylbenzoate synthase